MNMRRIAGLGGIALTALVATVLIGMPTIARASTLQSPGTTVTTTEVPSNLVIANLGNSQNSIVVGSRDENQAATLMNTAPPCEAPRWAQTDVTTTPIKPYAVTLGDFNGDGKPDLVMWDGSNLALALGNGDGSFQPAQVVGSTPDGTSYPQIAVADLTGNGKMDVVTTAHLSNDPAFLVWMGNGDGTFQAPVAYNGYEGSGGDPAGLQIADVGNGHPDIIFEAGISDRQSVYVFLNDGAGNFRNTFWSGSTIVGHVAQNTAANVVVGDFNGDGKPDLAAIEGNEIAFFAGNGDGSFQAAQVVADPNDAYDPALGTDTGAPISLGTMQLNGKDDLILSNSSLVGAAGPNGMEVWTPQGGFNFGYDFTATPTMQPPDTFAIGDLNGDGVPDVAVDSFVNGLDQVLILLNGSSASVVLTATPAASSVQLGQPVGFTFDGSSTGTANALCTTLTANLPAGPTWTTTTPGCAVGAGELSCSFGDVSSGGKVTATVAASDAAVGSWTATATLAAGNAPSVTVSSTEIVTSSPTPNPTPNPSPSPTPVVTVSDPPPQPPAPETGAMSGLEGGLGLVAGGVLLICLSSITARCRRRPDPPR